MTYQALATKLHSLEPGGIMLLLLILLVVLLIAAAPAWPYSRGWGYYPSGTLGTVLLILLILVLLGRI
jgi:hypothetical protein